MADSQCGVCKIDVIQCSNCEFWFHIQCISMKKSDLKVWSSPQLHFFCRNCSYVNDEYNTGNMYAASAVIKKPISHITRHRHSQSCHLNLLPEQLLGEAPNNQILHDALCGQACASQTLNSLSPNHFVLLVK